MESIMAVFSVSSNHSMELLVFSDVMRSALVSGTVRLAIVMTCSALVHAIGVFGIASNVINIVVFSLQGFTDTVNISLVTLAVSDLFTIVTAQWTLLCINPWFQEDLNLAFYAPETQTLTGGYPHIFFSRVSAWITAFISLERAVAVTQPFRVRRIFTRRLTTVFNIAVFPVVWLGAAPLFATARLGEKFIPAPVNTTLIGLLFSSTHSSVMTATSPVTEIFGPLTNFCVIIVCTAIIRFKVTSMAHWRSKVTGSHNQAGSELKNHDMDKATKNNRQQMEEKNKDIESQGDYSCRSTTLESKKAARDHVCSKTVNNTTNTNPKQRPKGFTLQLFPKNNKIVIHASTTSIDPQSTTAAGSRANPLSNKERRMIVMVSGVAAIFIACYTPQVVHLAARIIEPELSSTGRYRAMNASIGTIGIMLSCINASINSVVYWRMSSNYRATFKKLNSACWGSK